MYVCRYVCMSVTGLRLKYTGLCIVYVAFGTCCSGCHYHVCGLKQGRFATRLPDPSLFCQIFYLVISCHGVFGFELS